MSDRRRPRLLRALERALAGPGGPGRDEHLLVAASGGPDSTALLAALAALAPARGWRITAAHVAHALRGEESEADRARVARVAGRLGVGFVERAAAVAAGAGVEARARGRRHRALVAMAAEVGATRIVLAHTADDQAETVLLRLLRGAGRRGLGGMRPARGRVLRPLLGVSRADVRRYLVECDLPAGVDRSNADLRHARNRVRRLVLPLLVTELAPNLVPSLVRLATRLRDEDAVMDRLAQERLAVLERDGGLDVAGLAADPPGIARRVVRRWLERGTAATPSAAHVERVLGLAAGRGRGVVALPGPLRVLRAGGRLVRRPGRQGGVAPFTAATGPGAVLFHPAAGWRLRLSVPRARAPGEERGRDARRAVFDAAALPPVVRVRSPAPGDRIHLPGVGTRKLQDVLVDARVAREDRPGVPVVEADGAVVWIAGVARGSGASIRPETRHVIDGVLEYTSPHARCP